MKRSIGSLVLLMSVGLMPQTSTAQKTATSPVLQALEEEMKRAMTVLGKQSTPGPYFMGYEVNETATVDIQASQGALQSSEHDKIRVLDVEVRVGDYDLDNTHQIRGGNGGGGGGSTRPASVLMPIDDDVDAPIPLSPLRRVVVRNRLRLAIADRAESQRLQAETAAQIRADRLGALTR